MEIIADVAKADFACKKATNIKNWSYGIKCCQEPYEQLAHGFFLDYVYDCGIDASSVSSIYATNNSPIDLNYSTGPVPIVYFPQGGAVALTSLFYIDFDENIKLCPTGTVRIYDNTNTLLDTLNISDLTISNGNRLNLPFTIGLGLGTTYYVLADGVVKDYNGNEWSGISSTNTFTFTTTAIP